jgi:arylsulfatase A-like enzyme
VGPPETQTVFRWVKPVIRVLPIADTRAEPTASRDPIPQARNVVLLVLDACRADTLGCYGYGRDTTPFIDTLARSGLTFDRAYAAAPYTYSSTWSLYTSLYPYQHGAPMTPWRPSDSVPTLQKTLSNSGIITGLVSANPWFVNTGLASGFDEFLPALEKILNQNAPHRNPGGVTHRAVDFMFRHREQRFFLYAHYFIPHEPYLPPAPFANRFSIDIAQTMPATSEEIWRVNFKERGITSEELQQLKARYDETVLSVDTEVANICKAIETLRLSEDTVVIVTSDHGDSFMEHDVLSHNLTVFDEVTHIPLIVHGNVISTWANSRRKDIVRNVDIYPTICELMRVDPPSSIEGKSLFAASSHDDDQVYAFAQATFDRNPVEAYWWQRYKLIRDDNSPVVQVYDLVNDPTETSNLANADPVLTHWLVANARAWKQDHTTHCVAPRNDVIISPDIANQLKSLGYVAY